jgi:FixJ family two-component response regulator
MQYEATVFLVDADEPTQQAVRDCVDTMNLQCEVYASGQEFLDAYSDSQPGCVLLEVRIPDMNGLEVQESLSARGSTIPVIFLAERATVSIAVRTMRTGALNFLEKPFRESELWDAIEEAVRVDRDRRWALAERAEVESQLANLTTKEYRLLQLIAQGKSKQAISDEVGLCVRTVELHQRQLMSKIGVESLLELVRFAVVACDGHARVCTGISHACVWDSPVSQLAASEGHPDGGGSTPSKPR